MNAHSVSDEAIIDEYELVGQALSDHIADRADAILQEEQKIDLDDDLYLFTWSPNPEHLPVCDFPLQHLWNVNFLSDYLKCCRAGVLAVESTQKGNPHYHGWYQLSHDGRKEITRIAMIKTLQHFGKEMRITKAISKPPYFGCWYEKKNPLYYYKKDIIDSMLLVPHNPILATTHDNTNWDTMELLSFFDKNITFDASITNKLSDRRYYRDFYRVSRS